MASTYSTSLRLELMATGDQSGTWGDTTNTNLGTLLEQSITGYLSKAMADTNQTLTNLNGASDEARNAVINATGALTAAREIVVPTANKLYLVRNSTTGGFYVTVKTSAGTGVNVYPGQTRWVACDGTNVVDYAVPKFIDSQFLLADETDVTKLAAFQLSGLTTATTRTYTLVDRSGALLLSGGVLDTQLIIQDDADPTKQAQFQASGIAAGQTRTYTLPDASGTLALVEGTATVVETLRNRIVNHDMRVSQQNGTSSGTTNGYYPVDQWAQYFVTSAGTLTVAQVASVTPAGSPNRLRATVTVADASLAAGEFWTLTQNLEGSNVVDLMYGSASAQDIVLRFGFKGPAGTYAVHLGNSAANRSYVALFTIAAPDANTDTVQTVAIPGDTTGTWLTADGVIGITLDIVLACGSTFQGATGWQAGNILGTSAVSNGMGTGGAVFELFDVGLKLDPDATGVYGQYEVGEVDARFRAERYLEVTPQGPTYTILSHGFNSFTSNFAQMDFKLRKCKAPVTTGTWTVAISTYFNTTDRMIASCGSPTYATSSLVHNARLS